MAGAPAAAASRRSTRHSTPPGASTVSSAPPPSAAAADLPERCADLKDDGCGGCTTPLEDIGHMQAGLDATGRKIFYSTEASPPLDVISRRATKASDKLKQVPMS